MDRVPWQRGMYVCTLGVGKTFAPPDYMWELSAAVEETTAVIDRLLWSYPWHKIVLAPPGTSVAR